jgi:hypothetical protein
MPDYVIKRDGQKEPYNEEKIKNSLIKIGLSPQKIEEILLAINKNLPSVVTTREIFSFIYKYLGKQDLFFGYKFNLKQAIFKLGPTGYPFEKFISHLFKLYGYSAHHNVFLKGKCLTYEIDLVAEKDNIFYLGECKFHQKQGKKNDLKVALYVYARFLDLKENLDKEAVPMIITNTRFTSEVINYANCYDIKLISWNYPKENLAFLIDNKKAYPLTIFDFLPIKALQNFFNYDIVLITDFLNKDFNYLKKISNLDNKTLEKIRGISQFLINEI